MCDQWKRRTPVRKRNRSGSRAKEDNDRSSGSLRKLKEYWRDPTGKILRTLQWFWKAKRPSGQAPHRSKRYASSPTNKEDSFQSSIKGGSKDPGTDLDIIEPAQGPTPWVNPVVVVPKSGGDMLLCIDMRRANQVIQRERHPIPTVDEIMHSLNGSKIYTKLDQKWRYHQLELGI